MEPLPDWLYGRYARLYDLYGEESWRLGDAMRLWGDDLGRANAVVSELRRRGHAVLLGREGRRRLYRLLNPEDFIFAFLHAPNLARVQAERYRPLILKALRGLSSGLGQRLISVALYGSVARAAPKNNSDVDLYVVAEWASARLSSRIDAVLVHLKGLEQERLRLARAGIATDASVHPVTRDEAQRFSSLQLDVSHDAIVLYDPTGFLSDTLVRAQKWLGKHGAERVETEKGWFWRLDPGLEVGSRL